GRAPKKTLGGGATTGQLRRSGNGFRKMTQRFNFPWFFLFLMCSLGLLMSTGMQGVENAPPDRPRAEKLFSDGNWKEAYDQFRLLCLDPRTDAAQVSQDLVHAVQCLQNL